MSRKKHRRSHNPRIIMRTEEFRALDRIHRKLERRWRMTELDQETLQQLSIARGSPFDIDQDDPIDVDPRFFLPGPVENMEHGLKDVLQRDGLESHPWPEARPIMNHLLQNGSDSEYELAALHAEDDAGARGDFCVSAAEVDSSWRIHQYIDDLKWPGCRRVWHPSEDGPPQWSKFTSDRRFMWSRGPGDPHYHPDIPHAMAAVYDASRPLNHGLLRSELLIAVALLKAQIRRPHRYVEHLIYPVLVVSFHGRFSARVIQAYFQHGQLIVRPSRLINLHTRVISSEVKLVIRWLNSRAVGDTRLPAAEDKASSEEGSVSIEVPDSQGPLSPPIHVR
ncbi:hypothetical protein F66182_4376 [Fusarium sp. NRRL 66182]|nr:hypothetical protein F66182_4376 [Fusarium sp. NRRL 66182]